jgi:hypothetical protein
MQIEFVEQSNMEKGVNPYVGIGIILLVILVLAI